MALKIYEEADPDTAFSQDGDFTSPFAISFDGRLGGSREVQLFVRNDDATKYYTSITLTVEDTALVNHVDGSETGFEWKLSAGDLQPTAYDWDQITAANTISLPNIGSSGSGDISTYVPFWLYIAIPRNVDIQSIDTISFTLTATETIA